MIIIIGPVTICVVINIMIVRCVHSNYRRVEPRIRQDDRKRFQIARRDVHLLRHMIIMLCVFILGWSPVYVVSILTSSMTIDPYLLRIFSFITEISLFIDVIDLYRYSRLLRQYLKRTIRNFCCCCFSNE